MKNKIRLTESELKSIIHEEVNDILSENSINAKKRNVNNAIDVFKKGKGGYNNINTFGIVTAEKAKLCCLHAGA